MNNLHQAFLEYHAAHPGVYDLLVSLARCCRASGMTQYGIASLFERVRWHYHVDYGEGDFKLNNNHKAFYARMIMEREPDLRGFFETRDRTWRQAA